MTAEYLLKEVLRSKEIKIDQRTLSDISDFKIAKEEISFDSFALIIGGHRPIVSYYFSMELFHKWCETNNLLYYMNELDREINITVK